MPAFLIILLTFAVIFANRLLSPLEIPFLDFYTQPFVSGLYVVLAVLLGLICAVLWQVMQGGRTWWKVVVCLLLSALTIYLDM
jgi:hypothetical protein